MRKSLKKIALGCAATMALSAVLSASAFAADLTSADYTFDKSAGTVTIQKTFADGLAAGQYTILIYKLTEGIDETNLAANDIEYINQDAKESIVTDGTGTFEAMGLKTGLTDGTYKIKIGGENLADGIFVGEFTVGGGGTTITLGDVNADDSIDFVDAGMILNYEVGLEELLADQLKAGDVNADDSVDFVDAGMILNYEVGLESW